MNRIFALIDCNNFFVSCERVFNPKLINKPVVILSNNDGCIIARSDEAKKLGIKMGEPFFKAKNICEQHNVNVLSSNYQLYGDFSQRVMSSLAKFTPNIEIYSIDEAFLELTGLGDNLEEYASLISDTITKWTGIPVSIGIAPTKTLAKLANHLSKQTSAPCNLNNIQLRQKLINHLSIDKIWGIGKQWSIKLQALGINNINDFINANPKFIRKNFSVVGEKIWYELKGVSCLEMESYQNKKNISSSRSFGINVTELNDLHEAISHHVTRAALKLRNQNSYVRSLYVYLKYNNDIKSPRHSYESTTIELEHPTNNTRNLIAQAKIALNKIYNNKYKYKKCGIIFSDLLDQTNIQNDLFLEQENTKNMVLEQILDHTNKKMGNNTLRYAALGTKNLWQMKNDFCSKKYTTSWKELPLAI